MIYGLPKAPELTTEFSFFCLDQRSIERPGAPVNTAGVWLCEYLRLSNMVL